MPPQPETAPAAEDDAELGPAVDVRTLPGGPRAALEAVLMVVETPVSTVRLATATGLPVAEVASLLEALVAEYGDPAAPRGFVLREVAGGWRLFSSPVFADVVGRFVLEGQSARLSQAALETLAIVAYRQPVTRGQVSAVRGVNVDGVMRTLVARGLVDDVGTDPTTGAHLYGTTGSFLERMGLTSLEDLSPLAPFLPDLDGLDEVWGSGAAAHQVGNGSTIQNEEQQ
ncbi:SMC-Scp complex subunit ScpB [Sanguibacter sp. A247]|uniref:SMC-Scp complex subunit ScpB n=1 Tax=unclassified Sanguibacter TaxID=2645534 RepID=UPI003FD811DD